MDALSTLPTIRAQLVVFVLNSFTVHTCKNDCVTLVTED